MSFIKARLSLRSFGTELSVLYLLEITIYYPDQGLEMAQELRGMVGIP